MSQMFRIDPALLAKHNASEIAALRPTIAQLVDRYGLAGKSVLSIGAGIGLEEMAMLQCGVRSMTMIDSDESGTLSSFLPTVAAADGATTYILGDIVDGWFGELIRGVDVLYVSGLTPDENLRDSTLWHPPGWLRLVGPRWPRGAETLHRSVMDAIERYVLDDGLFILQSYSDGVGFVRNRRYVKSWRKTLRSIDFILIEAYRFAAAPRTTLWVASRNPVSFAGRPELARFHGRSPLGDAGIVRFV